MTLGRIAAEQVSFNHIRQMVYDINLDPSYMVHGSLGTNKSVANPAQLLSAVALLPNPPSAVQAK